MQIILDRIIRFPYIQDMKTLATIVLTLALFAGVARTQAADDRVGVRSNQQGNTVYFTVYNQTDETVCLWPYVQESTNVYGQVVPMTQLNPGDNNVSIGAFSQSNSQLAWSIRVGS